MLINDEYITSLSSFGDIIRNNADIKVLTNVVWGADVNFGQSLPICKSITFFDICMFYVFDEQYYFSFSPIFYTTHLGEGFSSTEHGEDALIDGEINYINYVNPR